MIKYQKGFSPTLLVLCVFLVGIGFLGYSVYKNGQIKVNPPQDNANVTASPAPKSNIPESWITYKNPGRDYSFSHPTGLKSDTGAAGIGYESIRFSFVGQKQIATGRIQTGLQDGYSFTVTKIGSVDNYQASVEAQKSLKSSKENCLSGGASVSPLTETLIDGQKAYQYNTTNCFGNYTTTYISDGKNVFTITQLYAGDAEDEPGYRKITDQILSTFKFTK